jgi:hypothetical protein
MGALEIAINHHGRDPTHHRSFVLTIFNQGSELGSELLPPLRMTRALAAPMFVWLLLCGCQPNVPEYYKVEGLVTVDGAVIDDAIVRFENSKAGVRASTRVGSDGMYSLRVLKGSYSIAIAPAIVVQPDVDGKLEEIIKDPLTIPARYQEINTSGLSVTVSENTHYDISLESQPSSDSP